MTTSSTTTSAKDIEKVIDKVESLPSSGNVAVGGLKHVIVKEGKENEFESLFRELASKVREHDKGCNYYDLYRSEQPRTYLVMEQYQNKEALHAHQKSEHGKYYFPKIRELLEKIEVNYFGCPVQLNSI
jgi:quinol monooxygenase YgiN